MIFTLLLLAAFAYIAFELFRVIVHLTLELARITLLAVIILVIALALLSRCSAQMHEAPRVIDEPSNIIRIALL